MTDHPITPPPELVQQRVDLLPQGSITAFTAAAQWGSDIELEACCEWVNSFQNKFVHAHDLRLVRRPKPPSLKEQALLVLDDANLDAAHHNILLRTLEQLDD
jgi:hypothetical protein